MQLTRRSAAGLCVGHTRARLLTTHVHAPAGAGWRQALGTPSPTAAAALAAGRGSSTTTNSSSSSSNSHAMLEETVDAIATVVERADTLPSSAFEQHDLAVQMCVELQALNLEMQEAIQQTDSVLEFNEWEGPTLPTDVHDRFLHVYRADRKRQKAATKAEKALRQQERARKRADRQAHLQDQQQQHAPEVAPRATTAAAAPAPPQLQRQQLQQPHHQAAGSSSAALQRQQQADAMQRLAHPSPLQQQQPTRQRRRRTNATTPSSLAAPSVLDSSIASSSMAQPAAAQAAGVGSLAAPAPPKQATAAEASRSRARSSSVATAAAAATSSGSSSGSLAALATTGTQPRLGFAALPLRQAEPSGRGAASPTGRPAAAAASRRSLRAAGISRRGATAGAAAVAAPVQTAKLSDNTMHGLDMRAELLTADQEKALAVMVQDLLALEAVAEQAAAQLGRGPTDLEWMEAAAAAAEAAGAAEGDSKDPDVALAAFRSRLHAGRQAKQVMISANYKLVVSICRKYQGHGMAMGDLINEGISGLVKGVERFQPAKGFKFSTYAHWWIRQAVSRALTDQGRLVRLPSHLQDLMSKMSRAARAFEAQHGREPEVAELAAELGVEPSRVADAYGAVTSPRSLDTPMGGDADGATLGDILEDERAMSPEESVYRESLKADLEGVLAGLPERDAGVLRMRFGLVDGREHTLDEVGAKYQVTRERIRQVEARAIRQLRAHQLQPGGIMSDYQGGAGMGDKALAARTSSGTRKQS